AGIRVAVRHGDELRPLAPGDVLEAGDLLSFRVRSDGPRYLELRVRDAAGEHRLYPRVAAAPDAVAARVRPDEGLATDYVVPPGAAGKRWIGGLFGDRPFPLDRPPAPDVQVAGIPVDVRPAAPPGK